MTPSEQARADALADAETLRLFARDRHTRHPFYNALDWTAYYHEAEASPEENRAVAAFAAHAAFKAVPGLRGDR